MDAPSQNSKVTYQGDNEQGAYAIILLDESGEDAYRWDRKEWEDDPKLVFEIVGAISLAYEVNTQAALDFINDPRPFLP